MEIKLEEILMGIIEDNFKKDCSWKYVSNKTREWMIDSEIYDFLYYLYNLFLINKKMK